MSHSLQHQEKQASRLQFALTVSFLLHLLLLNWTPSPIVKGRLASTIMHVAVGRPPAQSTNHPPLQAPVQKAIARKPLVEHSSSNSPSPPDEYPGSDPGVQEISGEFSIGLGEFSPIIYHPPSQLEERPKPITPIPEFAIPKHNSPNPGIVVIRLFVSSGGIVDKLVVEDTNVSEEMLEFIRNTFFEVRFSPGTIEGYPVPSQIRIQVAVEPI